MKKISFLIPTFNRFTLTRDLVFELYCQTKASKWYHDVEIIVCDNSSDFNQKKCLSQYISQLDDFVIFHDTGCDIGPTENWIKCIEYSNSEFLLFVYSDDFIYPYSVDILLNKIYKNNVDLVFFSTSIGTSINDALLYRNPTYFAHLQKSEFLRMFLSSENITHSPASFVFRRSLFVEDDLSQILFIFEGAIKYGAGSDVLFCYNIFKNADFKKIINIDKVLMLFRNHENSFTSNKDSNYIVTKTTLQTKIYLAKLHYGLLFYLRVFLNHQLNYITIKRRMKLW